MNNFSSNTYRAGWVYFLAHPSFNGLLKIGFTEKNVEERVKELESATGAMPGYKIEFAVLVPSPKVLELALHRKLSHSRMFKNKEFFEVKLRDAIIVLQEVCNSNAIKILDTIDPKVEAEKAKEERQRIEAEESKKRIEIEKFEAKIALELERKHITEEKAKRIAMEKTIANKKFIDEANSILARNKAAYTRKIFGRQRVKVNNLHEHEIKQIAQKHQIKFPLNHWKINKELVSIQEFNKRKQEVPCLNCGSETNDKPGILETATNSQSAELQRTVSGHCWKCIEASVSKYI